MPLMIVRVVRDLTKSGRDTPGLQWITSSITMKGYALEGYIITLMKIFYVTN
jgi:hypothetical protein